MTISDERADFGRLSAPYRAELVAHSYRILGSVEDAEEVVQTAYLQAWRAYDAFEGRSSLRVWLYRIVTRAALKESAKTRHRPLPSTILETAAGHQDSPERTGWLDPIPDTWFTATTDDPATAVVTRESMRLAFVAALQQLPAQQRVVLLLREVLDWRAKEVADLLGISVAAVNSALQRARTRLPLDGGPPAPLSDSEQHLIDRYVAAFETADVEGLLTILTEDATWEMPPMPTWFAGRGTIVDFLRKRMRELGPAATARTRANGQPAIALYTRANRQWHAHSLHVLTLTENGVAGVVAFMDPKHFPRFALPMTRA
ncbi:sigma-70 family RNA polymerase sigma factor [Nocardia yunnanensis]|uniref:Sigma-70 family RNA polymerase sigma factor n=1 Tax=Nocardia yunnanensis TaxID=2382165 RepID=A0A386Z9A8_9NOCA|nr:RNA polymerase subunit sigma-70 [Nocardia yunnanensis]AYF73684.1 sigma-70 family RNA polymerase sigma factor [Nocardia yunnanensis]